MLCMRAGVLLVCSAALALTGCASDSGPAGNGPAERPLPFAIVTSGAADFSADIESSYYVEPVAGAARGAPVLGGIPAGVFIETAIDRVMTDKGYRPGAAAGSGGLAVAYHVVLGETAAGSPVDAGYGMRPGLAVEHPGQQHFEKGTLVLIVTDRASGRPAWRSALEGFARLDIPEPVRQQRINEIVARMLERVPRASRP